MFCRNRIKGIIVGGNKLSMKSEIIDKYLGKKVKVTMWDNEVESGVLHKAEDLGKENNIFFLKNYKGYVLFPVFSKYSHSLSFRKSHIKKIEELDP